MIKEIYSKSILRKQKRVDSWFISSCGMNLYRGCTHNCTYCDGRADKYQVNGEFGKDIEVKINAIEILEKELKPEKKRTALKKGYILLGGGVCDTYQPAESKFCLSKKTLGLIQRFNYPVHILTKSTLVTRDIGMISEINENSRAVVSFSFSSCDDSLSKIFEPGVPSPTERLEAIGMIKEKGIGCGMFLMPVIPYITDSAEIIEESIVKAKRSGVDFVLFGGMTMKEGRQKEYFHDALSKYNPSLWKKYLELYKSSIWGNATSEYYRKINETFLALAKKHHIPIRFPFRLYSDILEINDKIAVMLDHLHYMNQMNGENSFFGLAANSISLLKFPVSQIKDNLTTLKGVGNFTEKIIQEIIDTGNSEYFQNKMIL